MGGQIASIQGEKEIKLRQQGSNQTNTHTDEQQHIKTNQERCGVNAKSDETKGSDEKMYQETEQAKQQRKRKRGETRRDDDEEMVLIKVTLLPS